MKKLHPLKAPYCCPEWEKARQKGTDCEGWRELIWAISKEDPCEIYDDKPHIGNIGSKTDFPPLKYCPWCGHCWDKHDQT